MVFLTMVDIWRETVEELGGLRGFFYIFHPHGRLHADGRAVGRRARVGDACREAHEPPAHAQVVKSCAAASHFLTAACLHPGDRP